MREIKFRGKNISTGEWVYGCLVNNLWTYSEHSSLYGHHVCQIIVGGELDCWGDLEYSDLCITVDPKTVGQMTGLADSAGTPIYEGDIIKMNGGAHDVFFSVDFEDGCFVARVPWKKESSPELKYYIGWKEEIIITEVIGNIYETPELIKITK